VLRRDGLASGADGAHRDPAVTDAYRGARRQGPRSGHAPRRDLPRRPGRADRHVPQPHRVAAR
jgi:hypothetical protein